MPKAEAGRAASAGRRCLLCITRYISSDSTHLDPEVPKIAAPSLFHKSVWHMVGVDKPVAPLWKTGH